MPGMNCGSSTKLKRKNSWFFSLKLTSIRLSNELRCSNSFGEFAQLEKSEPVGGAGKSFNSAIAFGSSRVAGRIFRLQPARVNVKPAGALPQVPNGSRTKTPGEICRVVAGPKMVRV